MDNAELLAGFLSYCRSEKGPAETTVQNYNRVLARYVETLWWRPSSRRRIFKRRLQE